MPKPVAVVVAPTPTLHASHLTPIKTPRLTLHNKSPRGPLTTPQTPPSISKTRKNSPPVPPATHVVKTSNPQPPHHTCATNTPNPWHRRPCVNEPPLSLPRTSTTELACVRAFLDPNHNPTTSTSNLPLRLVPELHVIVTIITTTIIATQIFFSAGIVTN